MQESYKQHLCVVPGNSRSCEGDSGGPMICNDLQYGTCAFKYATDGTANVNCSNFNTQTIYMFLHYHQKWLKNITGGKKKKEKKRKRSSGNLLKARHYSLYIIFTILLCNMLTFI
ncbi:unnamed protein product [Macrosiphum euphorbiae]|uniref:Peptidase S1 domain-containing protein n=1 Tax=Macrosiphum euphorbiae TaxID=13131 RepID=A0AAV0WER7_9HEMI|nr:unnamed protein product [Macrosiphum euphorbiae]